MILYHIKCRLYRLLGLPITVGPIMMRLRYEGIMVDLMNDGPWTQEQRFLAYLKSMGWRER